jgi:hypothetical protein
MNLQEQFSLTTFISETKIIKQVPKGSYSTRKTYNMYLKLNG